jgi:hypothetical protein
MFRARANLLALIMSALAHTTITGCGLKGESFPISVRPQLVNRSMHAVKVEFHQPNATHREHAEFTLPANGEFVHDTILVNRLRGAAFPWAIVQMIDASGRADAVRIEFTAEKPSVAIRDFEDGIAAE